MIHKNALVEHGAVLGEGTRVWAFAHILPGAIVGKECNICDHTLIENSVRIGNRVTVKSGVYLWDGVEVEDDVFIGPCVTFTNDMFPRSKLYPESYMKTRIMQGSSIGANSTILPGLTIGRWAMIGAASLISKDVPSHALVYGHPGRQHGWVCRCGQKLHFTENHASCCEWTYEKKGFELEIRHVD